MGFRIYKTIKHGKFLNVSLELFVKHKPWNWKECHSIHYKWRFFFFLSESRPFTLQSKSNLLRLAETAGVLLGGRSLSLPKTVKKYRNIYTVLKNIGFKNKPLCMLLQYYTINHKNFSKKIFFFFCGFISEYKAV